MKDNDVLRRLRAANPAPMRAPADDDLFEHLVSEPGDARLAGAPAPGRRRLRRRVIAGAGLGITAAVAAAAVLVVTHVSAPSATGPGGGGVAAIDPVASTVLGRLAADAARVAPISTRYALISQSDTYDDLPGQTERTTSIADMRTGETMVYSTHLDLGAIAPGVRRRLRRELGVVGVDALVDPVAFLYPGSWYASFSTDPATLRAQLLPVGAFVVSTELGTPITADVTKLALRHHPLPAAEIPRSAAVRAEDIYEAASDLLWNPLLSPGIRSALYRVLATTPGVDVDAHATDPAGRPAVRMSLTYARPSGRVRSTTWESPSTGAILAQRATVTGPHAPARGTSTAVYGSVHTARTMPSNPYRG